MEILNLIALFLIPIIAVWVGQKLQDRAQKRNDKMAIFKMLMTNRIYGWSNESVYALNLIDIVFAKDEDVRKQWKKYYDTLCIENATESDIKKISREHDKLMEEMAKVLGYKDIITWETIQNPYMPKGMKESQNLQQEFQSGQVQLIQNILKNMQNENGDKK